LSFIDGAPGARPTGPNRWGRKIHLLCRRLKKLLIISKPPQVIYMNTSFSNRSITRALRGKTKRVAFVSCAAIVALMASPADLKVFAQTPGDQTPSAALPTLQPQTALLANPQPPQTPNADDAIRNFKSGGEPVVVPPLTFVDVNSGRFGKLEVDLVDGQFLDTGVDHLHMIAKDLDVRDGVLKSLDIAVHGGHLHDFIFDQLTMTTAGELNFDSGIFLNHHVLQFTQPAQADVSALISQESLNSYLASPKTLAKLSVSAGRGAQTIANLLGVANAPIGLSVTSANVALQKGNKVSVAINTSVGMGQVGLPIAGQVEGKLGLADGKLDFEDMHISTGGQDLPPEMAKLLLNKINTIAGSTQKSNDIKFQFTDLKVVSGKNIQLKGTALVSRLRFGV